MLNFEDFLNIEPYSLDKSAKNKMLTQRLIELTEYHKNNCPEYAKILESVNYNAAKINSYNDLPFLPVRLFKELELKSVPDNLIFKTMTSSGTTGQAVSKIFLDKNTASNQQKALVKIVSSFTGSGRMPMIIIDCPSVIKNRLMFSARGAGILGFSIFGAKSIYALDDDMKLNVDALSEFLEKFKDKKILLFGFTFMVWQHFYKELLRLKRETCPSFGALRLNVEDTSPSGVEVETQCVESSLSGVEDFSNANISFDLSNGILIHGGGWKKLLNEAVSPSEFNNKLKDVCGLEHVHNYYGMVEQTGSVYMECEHGHLHSSIFSDIIIRRALDFSECEIGEKGIIQVVSAIPESYPGHSLLTEDEGILLGEDDCPCGRKGKYFKVVGRLQKAELRGCSDTYAADFRR